MFEFIQALIISYLPLYEIQMLAYYSDIKAADSVYHQLLQNRFLLAKHIVNNFREMPSIITNIILNWEEIVLNNLSTQNPLKMINDLTIDNMYICILNMKGLHLYHYYPALFVNDTIEKVCNQIGSTKNAEYWATLMIKLYMPRYDRVENHIDKILDMCSHTTVYYDGILHTFLKLYATEAASITSSSSFCFDSILYLDAPNQTSINPSNIRHMT